MFFGKSVTRTVTRSHSLALTEAGVEYDGRSIPWTILWCVSYGGPGAIALELRRVNHPNRSVSEPRYVHIPLGPPLDADTLHVAIADAQKRWAKYPDHKGYTLKL